MLHTTPETREALLSYLADLQHSTSPQPLSDRLAKADPYVASRVLSYLASLNTAHLWNVRAENEPQRIRLTAEKQTAEITLPSNGGNNR
jgi:hypothetical protein